MSIGSRTIRLPDPIYFGAGEVERIPEVVTRKGKRAFLVHGRVVADIAASIRETLEKSGIHVGEFGEVASNPDLDLVEAATRIARDFKPDVIIGVGGGSTLDAAKAMGLLYRNEFPLWAYTKECPESEKKQVREPSLPVIAVPTTSGTGSEVTPVAVITNGALRCKASVAAPSVVPAVAIVDPSLTYSMPAWLTIGSGMDALAHAIEAYLVKSPHPFSDAVALEAIKLISHNLERASKSPGDVEAREAMSYGSLLAGMAIAHAGTILTHAIAHALGSLCHLHHGTAVAIMMPYVMKVNLPVRVSRYMDIATVFEASGGRDASSVTPEAAVDRLEELKERLDIPKRLRDVKVAYEMLDEIAQGAMDSGPGSKANNPVPVTKELVRQILEEAY